MIKGILPALAGVAMIYVPFLWCRRKHEDPETFGLSWKFRRRDLLECLAVTFCVLAPLTLLALRWPWEGLPRQSSLGRTLHIASAGIAAAIIEEVFFRGWIQPLLRRRMGAAGAIVTTSALFAASHLFVARVPFLLAVFFPGCVMGFLRERHGNISTSTLFHALSNVWAVWFAPLVWPSTDEIVRTLSGVLGF